MTKKKNIDAVNQARLDETRDAKNAGNGFKMTMSSGTHGAGDSYRNKR